MSARDQQDVDGVQPWDEVVARELAPEDEHGEIGADERDRLDDALGDAQTGAGQQVVGEGVAREALEQTPASAARRRSAS